ncbi:MAG TPA: O-antigen ligase family protein, partial [Crenalkalicoccus sp.]|nr:O-antigen ligase family protein [Crenalkalicoccus sp.]
MPTTPVPVLWALALASLVLPVALCMGGAAPVAKPAFLLLVAAVSALLARRHAGGYLAFLLCLVMLTPGLRHLVDWYAGYSQSNPMMLAPYAAILVALPTTGLYLLNQRRYTGLCAVMLGLIAIGVWITALTGLIQEPLLTALRWVCPILLALYIWARAEELPGMRASVRRTLRVMLPLIAAYGLVQFVSILPWDAYFMERAPISSIGFPQPFAVRVFSTMNHSGSFAAALATGILLLLPRLRWYDFVSVLLACFALFVTTQRSAMGALALTVALLAVIMRSRTLRRRLMALVLTIAFAVVVAVAIPGLGDRLLGSVASVAELKRDESAQQRLAQYDALPARIEERPLGWGLAWSLNPLNQRTEEDAELDSGVIDILLSFGIPGGAAYLAALAWLLMTGWRIASQLPSRTAKAELGVVLFGLSQLPFGSQHAGEHGIFL